MQPLNYAMLRHFTTVEDASVDDVMAALEGAYASNRAFNRASMTAAIMTAEKNGLIEEVRIDLDEDDELIVYYRATDEQRRLITSYIG